MDLYFFVLFLLNIELISFLDPITVYMKLEFCIPVCNPYTYLDSIASIFQFMAHSHSVKKSFWNFLQSDYFSPI